MGDIIQMQREIRFLKARSLVAEAAIASAFEYLEQGRTQRAVDALNEAEARIEHMVEEYAREQDEDNV